MAKRQVRMRCNFCRKTYYLWQGNFTEYGFICERCNSIASIGRYELYKERMEAAKNRAEKGE